MTGNIEIFQQYTSLSHFLNIAQQSLFFWMMWCFARYKSHYFKFDFSKILWTSSPSLFPRPPLPALSWASPSIGRFSTRALPSSSCIYSKNYFRRHCMYIRLRIKCTYTWFVLEKGSTTSPTIKSATARDTMNLLVVVGRSLLCVKTAMMTRQLPTITVQLKTINAIVCRTNSTAFLPEFISDALVLRVRVPTGDPDRGSSTYPIRDPFSDSIMVKPATSGNAVKNITSEWQFHGLNSSIIIKTSFNVRDY